MCCTYKPDFSKICLTSNNPPGLWPSPTHLRTACWLKLLGSPQLPWGPKRVHSSLWVTVWSDELSRHAVKPQCLVFHGRAPENRIGGYQPWRRKCQVTPQSSIEWKRSSQMVMKSSCSPYLTWSHVTRCQWWFDQKRPLVSPASILGQLDMLHKASIHSKSSIGSFWFVNAQLGQLFDILKNHTAKSLLASDLLDPRDTVLGLNFLITFTLKKSGVAI